MTVGHSMVCIIACSVYRTIAVILYSVPTVVNEYLRTLVTPLTH